jgi:hypothetical protein
MRPRRGRETGAARRWRRETLTGLPTASTTRKATSAASAHAAIPYIKIENVIAVFSWSCGVPSIRRREREGSRAAEPRNRLAANVLVRF